MKLVSLKFNAGAVVAPLFLAGLVAAPGVAKAQVPVGSQSLDSKSTIPPIKPMHVSAQTPLGKIGIFDLPAIRSVPLDPEVISHTENAGIVTETVRFTSVPGVRVLTILTYPAKAKGLPGVIFARRFGAEPRLADAKAGFVGVSVAPPVGNDDPKRMDSVGGPTYNIQASFRQLFSSDPNQSYLYHHIVALLRAIDYLETRPEINLAKTSAMGQDWTGMVVSVLHALDNRVGAYFVWQGAGFYADTEGNSGDLPARISRKAYEMYSPAAYAQFGSRPIYLASPLNSDLARLDAVIEFAKRLRSPKVLTYAPNREEVESDAKEFDGAGAWQTYLLSKFGQAPGISNGYVTVVNGKLKYACTATGQTGADLLISYGKPGDWTGRTWHRIPMKGFHGTLSAVLPVYDPKVPMYVLAQIRSKQFGSRGNVPQFIEPLKLGITTANAVYPHQIFTGAPQDALYVATSGVATYGLPGPTRPSATGIPTVLPAAKIPVYWDGMIRFLGIEPAFWKGGKELHFWLKGDGKASIEPLNLYLAYNSRNSLDRDQENYTTVPLVKAGEVFPAAWREFTVPLNKVGNVAQLDSLFFQTGLKPLQIAGISWR